MQDLSSLFVASTSLALADPLHAFNMRAVKYQVGQWVDVKDTIDQWLEAQITKVRPNQVFVHYNGWGSQWDEWIEATSPRIALFRTYTLQYASSRYYGPSPNIPPDAENHNIPVFFPSLPVILSQTMGFLERIRSMLGSLANMEMEEAKRGEKREESKVNIVMKKRKQQLAAQIAPLADRLGRILVELGPHFAHTADPRFCKDETVEPTAVGNIRPEVALQVPLMANPGDVFLITNLLDRVLFGEVPTLELHVHSPAEPAAVEPEGNLAVQRPVTADATEEFGLQTDPLETHSSSTETDPVPTKETGTGPDLRIETVEETKKKVAKTIVRKMGPIPAAKVRLDPRRESSRLSVSRAKAAVVLNGAKRKGCGQQGK